MRILLVLFFSIISSQFFAQTPKLLVEGSLPNIFLSHSVSPKENFYSIGRLFNQSPKSIEAFNKISMADGLAIGQVIKVPLNGSNFEVNNQKGNGEVLVPLYHAVAKEETLFRLSTGYGASVENIRKWNKLSGDGLEIGAMIIVGHLKTTTEQLAFLINIIPTVVPGNNDAGNLVNNEEASIEPKKELPITQEKKIAKEEKVLESLPAKNEKSAGVGQKIATQGNSSSKENTGKIDLLTLSNEPGIEGAFAPYYSSEALEKSLQNKEGNAATFKSTSGWLDKKYYALMNDVTPGTILKITSSEDKSIYVKVLGNMPEMRENNGLTIRLSNAAASYLGIMDPKFPVQISYYQ